MLWVFIVSGVLAGSLWAIRTDFWSGLQFGSVFAIALTVFLALVVLPVDFYYTKDLSNSELNVKQQGELKLAGNVEDVFQKAVEVLSGLGMISGIQPSRDKMTIAARTKISLFSFGEEVRLRFITLGKGGVKIQISSEPVLGYTKIDYGKNLRNVKSISKTLTENFKPSSRGEAEQGVTLS